MQIFRVKKPSCKILKTKNCAPFEVQYYYSYTPDMWQSKTLILSTNVEQELLELPSAYRLATNSNQKHYKPGDKWQSKTLFLTFARVLFSKITLSFTDIVKSCPSRKFLASQTCYLTLRICENKILAKISGFTVFPLIVHSSWMMDNRTVLWRSVVVP